jgi:polyhydroxybutyrate depolymerase
MRFRHSTLLLLAAATIGCAQEPKTTHRASGKYNEKFKIDEIEREFILRIPKGYDHSKPTPLVVALHGLTSDMNTIDSNFRLANESDSKGFIAIIPNGLNEGFRGWNTGFFRLSGTPKDSEFILGCIDQVKKEFNVDPQREFVIGHSNGAMMAHTLAATTDRFAAICAISGTIGLPGADASLRIPKPKSNRTSVMMIHGMKDTVVAYRKSDKALLVPIGAEDGVKWWAEQLGATQSNPVSHPQFTLLSYVNPGTGAAAELISCIEGTHDIMGAGSEKKSGIVAWEEAWKFFLKHPKSSDLKRSK